MKTKILVVAFFALSIGAFAGEKVKPSKAASPKAETTTNVCLTGIIIDEQTKETLAGVEVSIEGTSLKTYTDFEGKFSFDSIKPGVYKVNANIISYNKVQSQQVLVKENEMHSLNLELTAQNTLPHMDSSKSQSMLAGK
jgi:hypothetical protein